MKLSCKLFGHDISKENLDMIRFVYYHTGIHDEIIRWYNCQKCGENVKCRISRDKDNIEIGVKE